MNQGLLVMAYGTPRGLDDVESYYTDIRGGRPPSPEALHDLVERYRAIGGRSPLSEITRAQADGLQRRLGIPVYLGMKHSAPTIPDAVGRAADDGIERLVGLVLAPHYSRMSVGDYANRARRSAQSLPRGPAVDVIPGWHLEPGYIAWLADATGNAITELPEEMRAEAVIVFTAHSLPEAILRTGDPYPEQLAATATAVAERIGRSRIRVGWQSAGRTTEDWLGPDILAILEEEAARGTVAAVICPCGFVADHLEVLYDIDVEARGRARGLGIELRRTAAPNDDARFLDVLATVAGRALGEVG